MRNEDAERKMSMIRRECGKKRGGPEEKERTIR